MYIEGPVAIGKLFRDAKEEDVQGKICFHDTDVVR
jgi:hypothetical protein